MSDVKGLFDEDVQLPQRVRRPLIEELHEEPEGEEGELYQKVEEGSDVPFEAAGANGKWEPKKLNGRHRAILALYMEGKHTNKDIAMKLGVTPAIVRLVVKSKLGQQVIREWAEAQEDKLNSLMPLVVEALRAGLTTNELKTRLLAVDRYIKMTGRESGGVDVNVNIGSARTGFISRLKELAEKENVIEGTAEVVKEE